jgi:chromosome partitioning protein
MAYIVQVSLLAGDDAASVTVVSRQEGGSKPHKGCEGFSFAKYVERAYQVAAKHADLFDEPEPADAFVITDDFMSAGRISGALSIPIPQSKVGQFHRVSGNRLQVNESQIRHKTELEYLISIL